MLGSLQAGDILLADRAYDSDALREDLAARGAWANVKPMPNRRSVPAFSTPRKLPRIRQTGLSQNLECALMSRMPNPSRSP
jgi:hypothetical protein